MGVLLPFVSLLSIRAAVTHAPRPAAPPTKVHLTLATLHAATLSTPRSATDSVDAPYFLVSILGPHAKSEAMQLPESGHLQIHRDEALGARSLVDLNLEPGDSVQLLVSVLSASSVKASDEAAAAKASTEALAKPAAARTDFLATALAPVTKGGARWLGSAILLLTNDGGKAYWRALQCVSTCKVLAGATAAPIASAGAAPVTGVVELSGSGATYHMQLQGQQAR
jgi:hypothetical protein